MRPNLESSNGPRGPYVLAPVSMITLVSEKGICTKELRMLRRRRRRTLAQGAKNQDTCLARRERNPGTKRPFVTTGSAAENRTMRDREVKPKRSIKASTSSRRRR